MTSTGGMDDVLERHNHPDHSIDQPAATAGDRGAVAVAVEQMRDGQTWSEWLAASSTLALTDDTEATAAAQPSACPLYVAENAIDEPRFSEIMERGRPVCLEFADGEHVWGYAQNYSETKPGFFFFPTDPDDNNLRLYVMRSSLKRLNFLDD